MEGRLWWCKRCAPAGARAQLMARMRATRPARRRLSLTFFGLADPACTAAECGVLAVQNASLGAGRISIAATVQYPRPGRYIVRVQVRQQTASP